ncbi:uncharacterized protein L201_003578 [Kwoniella dendrophila CBS 6074]|uniref:Sister chromatid cohesion protein DCC1 n=1 Tax=Kwoniella dendrophila CBS 6074 TaxID=1295534 RepID=A0AAX4JVV6_9TREE
MAVGSNLPSKSVILRYPPSSSSKNIHLEVEEVGSGEEAEETYQLLELPPEIIKAIEASSKGKEKEDQVAFPLTIKGKPSDDAVLCTTNSTFLLRTVGISNSILVCRTPESDSLHKRKETLQIRDTCHEVLECVPIAPNLERIRTILKDSSWKGINGNSLGKRKRNGKQVKKWTKDQMMSIIQSSEIELEQGLKDRNVIEVEGKMLYLPPKELKELLSIILSLLTIHQVNTEKRNIALSKPIINSLEHDHEVDSSISKQVLSLYGKITINDEEEEIWEANTKRILKEIGNGLLIGCQNKKLDEFEDEWKFEVGEEWKDEIDITLLEGEYLLNPSPITSLSFSTSFSSPKSSELITHFPISNLPLQPSERFSELFLTREKWKPKDILPFLKGLTRDNDIKSRDKLISKFVRVVKNPKDPKDIWWFPRRSS